MFNSIINILIVSGFLNAQLNIIHKGQLLPNEQNSESNCINPIQREQILESMDQYHNNHNQRSLFLDPMGNGGMFGENNMITYYVDENQNNNVILDYSCNFTTYDNHWGTDIIIPTFWDMDEMNTPILAAADGIVVHSHDGEFDRYINWNYSSIANAVVISHDDGTYAWYWHMKKNSVAVEVDQFVQAGDTLGYVGSSGMSSWPHLHFEVTQNYDLVDPWHGDCNSDPTMWLDQYPYIAEYPLNVYNYVTSGVPISPINTSNVYAAVSENAPPIKHANALDPFWSAVFIRNLAQGDMLRWEILDSDGIIQEDYGFNWIPSENPNYWPSNIEILTTSWWYIWGNVSLPNGVWTQNFYVNNSLFNSDEFVVNNIENASPILEPLWYNITTLAPFSAEIPSHDNDGTVWKHDIAVYPNHGTIELYGGYNRKFTYTPNSVSNTAIDSVFIRIEDDKNESALGYIYFNIQFCAIGDVNNDEDINILDITSLVNCILSEDCTDCADLNGDSSVSIFDIIALVNIILE